MRFAAVFMALFATPLFSESTEEMAKRFAESEKRIVRLPPSAFRELPANLVRELQRRRCTVPQSVQTKKPHNVIKGSFAKQGQTDWAVLCSARGVSSILVFWGGSETKPAVLAPSEDGGYLQGTSATDIGYSRQILPVGKRWIMVHYRAYGGPKPPPIRHQGIDDAFVEKASCTLYFHAGKWIGLAGAD
jgi:hypothetical protein